MYVMYLAMGSDVLNSDRRWRIVDTFTVDGGDDLSQFKGLFREILGAVRDASAVRSGWAVSGPDGRGHIYLLDDRPPDVRGALEIALVSAHSGHQLESWSLRGMRFELFALSLLEVLAAEHNLGPDMDADVALGAILTS